MQVTTTGELVTRLIETEGALDACSAKLDGVRRWRDETLQRLNSDATE